ncbi:MAG: class I SAM-dependent methyltransferase [Hydrogenophilaceae bacterium]|nr:class I SAM-dependent methyltransferase [Hydrogenophilaceae bacterium]
MRGLLAPVLHRLSASIPDCFRVEFADGSHYQNRDGEAAFTLRFRSAAAESAVVTFGHIGVIEGYFNRSIEVEGNLRLAIRAGIAAGLDNRPTLPVRLRNRWHEFRRSNRDPLQAKRNAEYHYALGTDFYRLWLDAPYMMYTCAYWQEGTTSLEQAQIAKMEHVCRKLLLQPGDHVVDIGCGWGGFLFYAQERHGITGIGVNTTGEQVAAMRREIVRRGLEGQIHAVEADFRTVQGQFDKVISIGVLEHAGRDQLREVIKAHADSLKPGGLGVLHFIGHVGRFETEFWVRKHIFPGGWIPSLAETIEAMEDCGLEVIDVENLRRHYAHTLDAWAERFDAHWPEIQQLDPQRFTEHFRRRWRVYLLSCAEMFRSPKAYTHLFQIVYSKGNISDASYPMSRRFLYREET